MAKDAVGGLAQALRALLICLVYMSIGPSLILLNKSIMHDHGFPYPVALSAMGVSASAAASRFAVTMDWGEIRESSREVVRGGAYWRRVVPVRLQPHTNHQRTLAKRPLLWSRS